MHGAEAAPLAKVAGTVRLEAGVRVLTVGCPQMVDRITCGATACLGRVDPVDGGGAQTKHVGLELGVSAGYP